MKKQKLDRYGYISLYDLEKGDDRGWIQIELNVNKLPGTLHDVEALIRHIFNTDAAIWLSYDPRNRVVTYKFFVRLEKKVKKESGFLWSLKVRFLRKMQTFEQEWMRFVASDTPWYGALVESLGEVNYRFQCQIEEDVSLSVAVLERPKNEHPVVYIFFRFDWMLRDFLEEIENMEGFPYGRIEEGSLTSAYYIEGERADRVLDLIVQNVHFWHKPVVESHISL